MAVGRETRRRRRCRLTLVSVATCLLVSAPVRAEGLAEAVADAYRNDPQLQAQRAELGALDETVIEALAPYQLGTTINGDLN